MNIKGTIRLQVKSNPGLLAKEVYRQGFYQTFVDALEGVAEEYRNESYIGVTGDLRDSWRATYPRKEAFTFTVKGAIVNESDRAVNRIAGRPPGKATPVDSLTPWVQKKIEPNPKKARGIAFAIAMKHKREGSKRFREKENFLGIDTRGLPRNQDSRILLSEKQIAAKLKAFAND